MTEGGKPRLRMTGRARAKRRPGKKFPKGDVFMQSKLSVLKNIAWAAAIALCLLAVLIAFIIAAFTRYGGEQQDGVLSLGGSAAQAEKDSGGADATSGGSAAQALPGSGTLNTLAESADGGQSYIDSLTFLCDSALIGLRDYGLLTAGTATSQVWGSAAGDIPAGELGSCLIKYPADGSEISPANAAMVAKPSILVISLGMDGLAETDQESFTAAYTKLVTDILAASPETRVICCSLSSVSAGYTGVEGITKDMVIAADEWIKQVCINTGAYFADAGSAVTEASGLLLTEYASANGKALNSSGLNKILEYLRSHAL